MYFEILLVCVHLLSYGQRVSLYDHVLVVHGVNVFLNLIGMCTPVKLWATSIAVSLRPNLIVHGVNLFWNPIGMLIPVKLGATSIDVSLRPGCARG